MADRERYPQKTRRKFHRQRRQQQRRQRREHRHAGNERLTVRRLPIGVNLRGVAAGRVYAPPLAEGSRIKMVPSLDRRRNYCEVGRNAWTTAAPGALGLGRAPAAATSLKLTPMGGCRTITAMTALTIDLRAKVPRETMPGTGILWEYTARPHP